MITEADFEGGDLEAARQPPTADQSAWDEVWQDNRRKALARGRTPNQAAQIADTRTEAQKGQRPERPKETR